METRITDVDVTETDAIDSRDLEAHIDVDAVHDQLLRTFDVEHDRDSTEVVDTDTYDIESEFTEDDRISTTLMARQITEREVPEQWRFETEVVAGELRSRETERESVRESGLARRTGEDDGPTGEADGPIAEGVGEADPSDVPTDDVGKPVVISSGATVGMITEVEDNVACADSRPGTTERITAKLGWGGKDGEDRSLDPDQIAAITDDEVRLAGEYDEDLQHVE